VESDHPFPRAALLLPVLWFVVAATVAVICFGVGWAGLDYFDPKGFFALAVVFLIGTAHAARTVFVASRLFVALPAARSFLNGSAFVLGVLIAGALALLCVVTMATAMGVLK
jgi:hypothetical protein